jgi:hypothetical protein
MVSFLAMLVMFAFVPALFVTILARKTFLQKKSLSKLEAENQELKNDLLLIPVDKLFEARIPSSIVVIPKPTKLDEIMPLNLRKATEEEYDEFSKVFSISDVELKNSVIKFLVYLRKWHREMGNTYLSQNKTDQILCCHYKHRRDITLSAEVEAKSTQYLANQVFGNSFVNSYISSINEEYQDIVSTWTSAHRGILILMHHEIILNLGCHTWCERLNNTSLAMSILDGLMGYSLEADLLIKFSNPYDFMGLDTFHEFCKLYLRALPISERIIYVITTLQYFKNTLPTDPNLLNYFADYKFGMGKYEAFSENTFHKYTSFTQLEHTELFKDYAKEYNQFCFDEVFEKFATTFDISNDSLFVNHIQQHTSIQLP